MHVKQRAERRGRIGGTVRVPNLPRDELRFLTGFDDHKLRVIAVDILNRQDPKWAEAARETFLLLYSQDLIAKHKNLVFKESPFDFVKHGVRNRTGEIYPTNFRPNDWGEPINRNVGIGRAFLSGDASNRLQTISIHSESAQSLAPQRDTRILQVLLHL
ncbi:hypothetical protein GCM10011497_34990 [Elstera cyanobacteriorum]|nr:hypothetical protein GCM10011497_34990 [Elstera cyanobacteriorum]